MGSLDGKIALVTGGSRGIGAAVSKRLAKDGAFVIVNYSSSPARAEEVVAEIQKAGGKALAMGFDVSDGESVESSIKQLLEQHGKIDFLVNNAGIAIDGLLVRTKDEDWTKTMQVNLTGAFNCARAVAKSMMKARTGRIVNISSVIGLMGNAGQVAYSTSKAGLLGLTKSIAKELGSRNVTVNAIAPGYIETEMTHGMNDQMKESILSNVPLARIGTADDIAGAVAFLCSDDASYITGAVLSVNGGMYL